MVKNAFQTNRDMGNTNSYWSCRIAFKIITNLIEQRIHHFYANWPAEPIPALDEKTPSQAITTSSSLERVKGLIRGYEEGEDSQASEQGRREISYAFLWNAVGLKPDQCVADYQSLLLITGIRKVMGITKY